MDPRTPVPLTAQMAHQKRRMRAHLRAVQTIIDALAAADYGVAERAAREMGYSEETAQMCRHLGAAAPLDFTKRALTFHRTASTIADAAHARDRQGILQALGRTLTQYTACHAAYRQQIVDDFTRQRLMDTAPSHAHEHSP